MMTLQHIGCLSRYLQGGFHLQAFRTIRYCSSHVKEEATIPLTDCKLHKLNSGPPKETTLNRTDALTYYKQMKATRRIAESVLDLYKSKHIYGAAPLATGKEACAAGIAAVLRPDDAVSCTHRNHVWAYLKGVTALQILAELTGRRTGSSKGKGGPMHLYRKESNFFGGSAIIGSSVPLGTGMALAMNSFGRNGVSVAVYGEGAANQGQVFEAFNMAKLWNLPVIFVCENNGIARQTNDVHVTTASTEFYTRGDYIPGIWLDGMDILRVRETARWAVDYCRSGQGPIILEMDSAHFYGHAVKADAFTPKLSDAMKKRDPVANFKKTILECELCLPHEIQAIDEVIDFEMEKAVKKARTDPVLSMSDTYTEVYKGTNLVKTRGCDAMSFHNSSTP